MKFQHLCFIMLTTFSLLPTYSLGCMGGSHDVEQLTLNHDSVTNNNIDHSTDVTDIFLMGWKMKAFPPEGSDIFQILVSVPYIKRSFTNEIVYTIYKLEYISRANAEVVEEKFIKVEGSIDEDGNPYRGLAPKDHDFEISETYGC